MELTFERITEERIAISVIGVCRDSFAGQDEEPLEQFKIKQLFEQNLMLSLENVSFLNSSGIGWLLFCQKRFQESGGRMILHSVPTIAMNVIRLMRLNEVFEIANTQEEASRLLSSKETSV